MGLSNQLFDKGETDERVRIKWERRPRPYRGCRNSNSTAAVNRPSPYDKAQIVWVPAAATAVSLHNGNPEREGGRERRDRSGVDSSERYAPDLGVNFSHPLAARRRRRHLPSGNTATIPCTCTGLDLKVGTRLR